MLYDTDNSSDETQTGSSEIDDDIEILLLDTTYPQSWTWTPSQPPRYRGN